MLGKTEDKRRAERQRMRWWDGITESKDMNLSRFWETVRNREAWGAVVRGVIKSQTRQQQNNNNPSMDKCIFHQFGMVAHVNLLRTFLHMFLHEHRLSLR